MPDYSDIRLLVVDDEAALRNLLGEVLRDDGFNVETAETGEQALALFEKDAADIILSDMSMPGMSGIDLLKKVKELRGERVEFVIITANATLDTAIAATKYGAVDYLRKPVDDISEISRLAERLAARVRERREKERVVSGLMDIARTLVGPSGDPFLVRTDGVIERLPIPETGVTLSAGSVGAAKIPLADEVTITLAHAENGVRILTNGAGDVKLLRIDGVPAKEAHLRGGEHVNVGAVDFRFVNPQRLPDSDKLLESAAKLFGSGSSTRKSESGLKFTGRLEETGLPNLLQMMNLLNKNGLLQVREESGTEGEMQLRDGELFHAKMGTVEGRKAVQRMLGWNKGEFSFESRAIDGRRTIEERTDALLLDSMRQIDELKALGKSVPPRNLRVAVARRPTDLTPEEKAVLDAVSRFGTVGTILDKSPVADLDILRALIRFRKEGAITVVAAAPATGT